MPLIGLDKVEKAIDDLVVETNNKVKSIWVQGLSDIITMTPVHFQDGGRLRNNWFLTVNKPSGSTRNGNPRGNASYSSLGNMPDYVLGKTFYFTNNMPYANVVEYGGYPNNPKYGTWTGSGFQKLSQNGYSKQAPAGMVRINIKKMVNKL
jgi:hypothetical protein